MKTLFTIIVLLLSLTTANAQSAPGKAQPFTIYCNNTATVQTPSINCLWYILPQTTKWFTDTSPPANISKIGDRLFIGDAINLSPLSGFPCGTDWFTNFQSTLAPNGCAAYSAFSQVVIESGGDGQNGNGSSGFVSASQSKHSGSGAAILPISAFGVINNSSVVTQGWGYYGECQLLASAFTGSTCIAMELNARTMQNIGGNPDPYQQSSIVGIQNACGAGVTPTGFNCGAAMQVLVNPTQWNAGVIFFDGSIASGSGGSINAVSMPLTYRINWFSSAGTLSGSIGTGGGGNIALDTPGGGTISANGNPGVSCPAGISAATFRSGNGIVTHC